MSRTMIDNARTGSPTRPDPTYAVPDTAAVIPAAPDSPDVRPVVVRRHGSLSAVIGLGASALSGLYLVRAVDQGGTGSWGVGLVLGLLALFHLTQWVDSRTPLLVADGTGVRLRLGNVWHGLLWEDIDRVVVHPRQGLFKDGRVVVHPADEAALRDLSRRSRRRVAANTRLYGAPFALPLGLTTVSSTDDLSGSLEKLAAAGAAVDVLGPVEAEADRETVADADTDPGLAPVPATEPLDTAPPAPDPTREPTPGHEPEPGPEPGPAPEPEPGPEPVPTPEPQPTPEPAPGPEPDPVPEPTAAGHVQPRLGDDLLDEPPQPARPVRHARRAQITRPPLVHAPVHGQLALQQPLPDSDPVGDRRGSQDDAGGHGRGIRARGNMSLVLHTVEPEAVPREPEPAPHPVQQPVIGPVVAEARELLGLTVDELASRTRIRPHVIEAIEVDDFGPCAGDFYARGHLRALGRVLGIDPEPLVEVYEARYAVEPISARRVFEAELAAGDSGPFRGVGTATGPRWGALLAAVVVLAVFWGLAGYFLDDAGGAADDVPDRPGSSATLRPGAAGR